MRIRLIPQLVTVVMLALLAACGAADSGSKARVFFTNPADGASVSSPVHVTLGAENFTVEPAGEVKAGAGHLHITVDGDCTAAGQIVPKDDTHLHYGKAQMEADLELTAGTHTLCLQAADGAHTALADAGLTQKITITVK